MVRPKIKEDGTAIRCFLSTRDVINRKAYRAGLGVPDYLKTIFPNDDTIEPGAPVKTCFACQTVKPVKEFYRSKVSPDGYATSCKNCQLGRTVKK